MKALEIGGAILAIGTLPLLLYVMFGPKDGNPVGFGILMWLSWLIGGILVIWGTISAVVAFSRDRRA